MHARVCVHVHVDTCTCTSASPHVRGACTCTARHASTGELAFTLLGVDFHEKTGELRYLIMDPHYQGADELASIQPKWVGWKTGDSPTHLGTKLFKSDTFYSFMLPERPSDV